MDLCNSCRITFQTCMEKHEAHNFQPCTSCMKKEAASRYISEMNAVCSTRFEVVQAVGFELARLRGENTLN